jgi:WD40-like Beta Propeller Repeat
MRGRDLALLGALFLVSAAAVIDVLWNGGDEEPSTTETRTQSPPPGPQPQPQREAPDDYPRGVLRGSLVFADRPQCGVRVFDLAGGRERIVPPLTACTFWASPTGVALAYRSDGRAFFRDLAGTPWGDLGSFSNLAGPVTWSPDGRRAAWCVRGGGGFDFDVVEHELPPESLNNCPAAYAPNGEPAFVLGGQVIVDGRPIVETMGQILFVSGAADGSIALVVATQPFPPNRLERWERGRLVDAVDIPARLGRWPPVFSPDNCAALFRDIDQGWFEVIALDCFEAERPDLLIFGDSRAVAWSPDGRWIAVAYSDRIGFHRVADGEEVASWPTRAAALAWTAD